MSSMYLLDIAYRQADLLRRADAERVRHLLRASAATERGRPAGSALLRLLAGMLTTGRQPRRASARAT